MDKKELTIWEAACIITGYGIGGGVLAMPYLAQKSGIITTLILLVLAFSASWLLHLFIAEIALKSGDDSQIVSTFSKFLFRGKARTILTIIFFVLLSIVLITNLTAYIVGAAEVISGFIPISNLLSKVIFYILAATVVLLGLKAVGLSEKIAVTIIFLLIAVLSISSFMVPHHSFPMRTGNVTNDLSLFGMAMFSFSAFFSVPQAVSGLSGDKKKIKKAVFIGLFNIFIMIVVIVICSIVASTEVTEVAMTGWSAGIGNWAQVIGGIFTVLAMLTTYWSISLALSNIVKEQLHLSVQLCWIIATFPSLFLSLFSITRFINMLEIAGGTIAIIVALMVIPTYRNAHREVSGDLLDIFGGTLWQILVAIAYIFMAIGNII